MKMEWRHNKEEIGVRRLSVTLVAEGRNGNQKTDEISYLSKGSLQALLKMDCQGLVARLVMDFVLLTTAVEVAGRWRELAERLVKVSRQQMDAYEAPHRDKNGVVDSEVKCSGGPRNADGLAAWR
ncbi:SH3 domain-binding protein 4 [Ataeniobius toweri]|uniref:SH3 domain-binding protein 4 n=1 Tax=Ataeniobius toweri TaxID=208326 RepID=A0ABU7CA90_9TELE|nr:SH3 domain-binding protein 4 [Ataeniobius toweri]